MNTAIRLTTIRARLWLGFGILVTLLVIAGAVANSSFTAMSKAISESLDDVQEVYTNAVIDEQ